MFFNNCQWLETLKSFLSSHSHLGFMALLETEHLCDLSAAVIAKGLELGSCKCVLMYIGRQFIHFHLGSSSSGSLGLQISVKLFSAILSISTKGFPIFVLL